MKTINKITNRIPMIFKQTLCILLVVLILFTAALHPETQKAEAAVVTVTTVSLIIALLISMGFTFASWEQAESLAHYIQTRPDFVGSPAWFELMHIQNDFNNLPEPPDQFDVDTFFSAYAVKIGKNIYDAITDLFKQELEIDNNILNLGEYDLSTIGYTGNTVQLNTNRGIISVPILIADNTAMNNSVKLTEFWHAGYPLIDFTYQRGSIIQNVTFHDVTPITGGHNARIGVRINGIGNADSPGSRGREGYRFAFTYGPQSFVQMSRGLVMHMATPRYDPFQGGAEIMGGLSPFSIDSALIIDTRPIIEIETPNYPQEFPDWDEQEEIIIAVPPHEDNRPFEFPPPATKPGEQPKPTPPPQIIRWPDIIQMPSPGTVTPPCTQTCTPPCPLCQPTTPPCTGTCTPPCPQCQDGGPGTGASPTQPGTSIGPQPPTQQLPKDSPAIFAMFPFCIPWDVYRFVTVMSSQQQAPRIEADAFAFVRNYGIDAEPFVLDFADFQTQVTIFRYSMLALFVVGLMIVSKRYIWTGGS